MLPAEPVLPPPPVWNLTTDTKLADKARRLEELLNTSESVFAIAGKGTQSLHPRHCAAFPLILALGTPPLADETWEDLGSTATYKLMRKPKGAHPTGILFGTTTMHGFTVSEVMTTIRDDGCRRVWDQELYDHTEFSRVLSARSVLIRACMKGRVCSASFDRRAEAPALHAHSWPCCGGPRLGLDSFR